MSFSTGPFLPSSIYLPEDETQRVVTTNHLFNQIMKAINLREISSYELSEFFTGQLWFSQIGGEKRAGYRKVYQFGTIATGATLNIAHGLSLFDPATNLGVVRLTSSHGQVITDITDFRPLPRISATLITDQVSLDVDATNIVIVNGATAPNIVSGIVVLEYLKN